MPHRTAQPPKRANKGAHTARPLAARRAKTVRLIEDQPDTFVKPLRVPEHFSID